MTLRGDRLVTQLYVFLQAKIPLAEAHPTARAMREAIARAGLLTGQLMNPSLRASDRLIVFPHIPASHATGASHRKLLAVAVMVLFALAGCGKSGPDEAPGKAAAPPKAAGGPPGGMPVEVEVIVAGKSAVTMTQELPGRLAAVRTAQVRARVEGILEKRLFEEGSDVREGATLYRIDTRNVQAALDSARADHAAARLNAERFRSLLALKAVSQQDLDLAEARLKQAEAALTRATIDVENASVPAPISGRIGRSLVTEGALVGRGEATPLAVIEQIDPIHVNFTQSASDALRLQQAIKAGKMRAAERGGVDVILEDGTLHSRPGRIIFSDMAVDPTTGSVSLRAIVDNPGRELLPGTFVRIRVPTAVAEDVIRLPQRAVQAGPTGQFVTIVGPEGKATVRPVKTMGMSGPDFVVSEGLAGGEQVIVNGLQRARPGSVVRAVPLSAPSAPPRK